MEEAGLARKKRKKRQRKTVRDARSDINLNKRTRPMEAEAGQSSWLPLDNFTLQISS
jgi:hypothetical protein